jgi:hypothetical protein
MDDDLKVEQLPIRDKAEYEEARNDLLSLLREVTIPKIPKSQYDEDGKLISAARDNVIGRIGRTTNFGFGRTRRGYQPYRMNERHPELLRALVRFGNLIVPKGWTYQSITLNHGVKAKKHTDGQNNGRSVIIGIGDYTGGKVNIFAEDGTKRKGYDVLDSPTMFNGAIYPHSTQPFKGERYTIIYFKQKKEGTVKGVVMRGKGAEIDIDNEDGKWA